MDGDCQALYFHLLMNSDTVGVITGTRRLAKSYSLANPSDALSELIRRGYLIEAEHEGETIHFVTHYLVHNTYDEQKLKRSAYYPLARALFGRLESGKPYALRQRSDAATESSTAVSETLTEYNGIRGGYDAEPSTPESELTSKGEEGSGGGSLEGGPPKPRECPKCHHKTLQLFLEQEHPQAQCTYCQTVAYIDPDTGELSQFPFRR